MYKEQLKTLGFSYFDEKRIRSKTGQFLYRLVFVSKNERGLKIWRNVDIKDADGQHEMFP